MSYCLLQRAAYLYPHKIALITPQESYSFHQLYALSLCIEEQLPKDCNIIACRATPSAFYIALLSAVLRLGKILLPLSPLEPNITALCTELKAYYLESKDLQLQPTDQHLRVETHAIMPDTTTIEPAKPCTIMLSSGSTGTPKKIVHSLVNHICSVLGGQQVFRVQHDDIYLLSLPLNHVGGQSIIFKSFITGCTMLVADKSQQEQTLTQLLLANKVTVLSLVPTQVYRLLHNAQQPFQHNTSLRAVLLGGAHIDNTLIQELLQQQPKLRIYGSYGSTEMASQICTTLVHNNQTTGFPLPYRKLGIHFTDKKQGIGEIVVQGDTLALGYWLNGQLTAITDSQGWFHTHDIGKITPQGLQILGRLDNQFICGGENIMPEAIEKALLSITSVKQAVVIPVPDPQWGFVAGVFLATDQPLVAIKQQLQQLLSPIYIPKLWAYWPAELTFSFKIQRNAFHAYQNLLKHL